MNLPDKLFQKYGDAHVTLERVASDYYGVTDPRTIRRMAEKNQFPGLKPFRARDSKQAPYFVSIENLAKALEERERAA